MNRFLKPIFFAAATSLIFQSSINAQDYCDEHSGKKRASVWAGFGSLSATVNQREFAVINGSQVLDTKRRWTTDNALTFNIGFETEIAPRLSLFGDAVVSLGVDDTSLVNEIYVDPFTGNLQREPGIRERSPNSDLDHYVQLDVGFDYELVSKHNYDLDIRFGFRYTDLAFSSEGGTASIVGFPGSAFPFPDGATQDYHKKLPALYISPRIDFAIGDLTNFKIGGLAGFTFLARTTDFRFDRFGFNTSNNNAVVATPHGDTDLDTAFIWGIEGSIEHRFTDRVALYVNAAFEETFEGEGQQQWSGSGSDRFTVLNGRESSTLSSLQINAGVKVTNAYKPLFKDSSLSNDSIFRY